jgi:outer membrane scaffolding protein for murein synthesis (MipA/OmpV family)
MTFPYRALTTLAAGALMSALSGAVLAQSAPQQGNNLVVGGGAAFDRNYTGGDDSQVRPALFVDYSMANGFFASVVRGLGYAQQMGALTVSAALGYSGGRSDSKEDFRQGSDHLRGMGDIDGGAAALLGLRYKVLSGTTLSLDANLAATKRDRGDTLKFGIQQKLMAAGADRVELSGWATYGDDKNMQTWFGVTAAQSASSGFAAYAPKSGLEEVGLNVAWTHSIDRHWSVRSALGVKHLTGDAADSPLTVKKTYPTGVVTANYAF